MPSKFINQTTLEYDEEGKGEPVLLVHGSASDYRSWHMQKQEFSGYFRTIVYSRRYHWPNSLIPKGAEYTMTEQLDDLRALLHSLDDLPVHLVGHSSGAFLCLFAALKEPSLVKSLVLCEPPVITLFVSNSPTPKEILKLFFTRPATAFALIKFGINGLMPATKAFKKGKTEEGLRIFGDAIFGKGKFEEISEIQRKQAFDNLLNVKAELLGPGFMSLNPDHIQDLRIPVLLVSGEKSISLFQRLTGRLEELLPHTERCEILGASHAMHQDNAPAFNAAVISFLQSIGREKGGSN